MSALYLSGRIKNIIMIGVVIIALIIAFNKSKIVNTFLKPSDTMGKIPKEANNLFENSKYNTKLELQYIAANMTEIKPQISEILNENKLKVTYSKFSSNNCTWLVEIPLTKYEEIIKSLRNHDELNMEELVQLDNELLTDSIKDRINDNEERLEFLDEGFKNARTAYDQENYNQNIIRTERIIDSLKTVLRDQEKISKNIYTKIDISHFVSRADVTQHAFKSFLITFVISLLFISVALFVIYFIIVLFTKLFSVLGIKTTHGQPSRYSSGSSYGYGYDYGSRKKIKRKYIRKPRGEGDESTEENKDKDEK